MGVSVERAERVLRQGANLVADVIDDLPSGHIRDRGVAAWGAFNDLTWAEADHGGVHALEDGIATDVFLVLIPDRELVHLPNAATFQTEPHDDGTVRLNVRTVPLTALWAGLGLFHELSHVYDFRAGIEPRSPSPEQYAAGEARAFHLQMVLLDKLSSGRLTTALRSVSSAPRLSPSFLVAQGDDLVSRVERRTAGPGARPPAGDNEMGMRSAFYRVAVLMASHLSEADPTRIESPDEAGSATGDLLAEMTGAES